MKDICHDGIEVRGHGAVGLFVYLSHAIAEGQQGFLVILLLHIAHAEEVVKSHFIGIILHSLAGELHHSVKVVCRPCRLDERETCCHIVGRNVEHPHNGRINLFLGHILQCHIGHLQLGHVGGFLGLGKNTIEQVKHLGAVASLPFVVGHHLFHEQHLVVDGGLGADEQLVLQRVGQLLFAHCPVVIHQRHARHHIFWLYSEHFLVLGVGIGRTPVLQEPVALHHSIAHVVGVLVGETFQHFQFFVFLSLQRIYPHFGQGRLFVCPVEQFHPVDGMNHIVIIALFAIQLNQHLEHVASVGRVGKEFFKCRDGTVIIFGGDMATGQTL